MQDNPGSPVDPTESMTFSLYGLTGFDVQYWDGSTWLTVPGGSVTGNNKVWRNVTFTPIATTKIRVVCNASVDGWSRITEVEAWTAASGGSSSTIHWLVTDQLGTPRMIFDQTGNLQNVTRHDYLPFGEELFGGPPNAPGVGGRTTMMGYTASDGARQKFTQKERDNETGLDFFETRYYGSSQGRFTGPDSYNIIFEKEKGQDEKERRQVFLNYCLQPQIWNKYTYGLNNPLKYNDPDGRRALTDSDLEKIEKLNKEWDKAVAAGDKDLANSISKAVNEIVAAIDAVPEGQQDPSNLKTVLYAVDHLGNTRYASGETGTDLSFHSNGWNIAVTRSENKCNFFVGISWALGGGIGLIGNGNTGGVPAYGTKGGLGALWGNGYIPGANEWAAGRVQNFQPVTSPQLGDVAAWGARVGAGHSAIYIGGGATVYAQGRVGVKVQTVNYVTADQQRPVSYMRYKP